MSKSNNATVDDFLVNGKWNERMFRKKFTPLIIPVILNTTFKYQQEVKEIAVWKPIESGNFTCASAWEVCKYRGIVEMVNS